MASLGLPPSERDDPPPTFAQTGRDILLEAHNINAGSLQSHHHNQPARRGSFGSQRLVCEQTLEILRQVLRSTATARQAGPVAGEPSLESPSQQPPQGAAPCPGDSRSLLLIVVLHRRLLEQVASLRAELPPICRLIAPSMAATGGPGSANQPLLDRSLASANHRALADLEERLYLVVSRHSLARLSEALADPLLKLEEFLLVFELVNDLVCFVGQKCKQNYSQRGKQLLNELTPVTGCPSLSSSEEDSDEDLDQQQLVQSISQQQRSFGGSTLALAMQSNSQGPPSIGGVGGANQLKRFSQQERYANYDPTNEFVYHQQLMNNNNNNSNSRNNSRCNSRNNSQSNLNLNLSRPPSRQQPQVPGQLFQLPTSINIVAPSPMGSVRDVSRLTSRGDSPVDTKLFSTNAVGAYGSAGQPRPGSPMKRHSHQDILANMQQQQQQQQQLIDKTNQMSLTGGVGGGGRRSIANCLPGASSTMAAAHCDYKNGKDGEATGQPVVDDKSRSELIDELLKTINDDSFNEFIDFNNKLSAAGGTSGSTSSQPDALNSANLSTVSAMELANAARSKSAIGDNSGRYSTSTSPTIRRQSCSPAGRGATASPAGAVPPRSLNLSSAGGPATRLARGSICVGSTGGGGQPTSTFDNVIRRMSTNFVQNFNKMSGAGQQQDQTTTSGGGYGQAPAPPQMHYPELNVQQASLSNSATQLRREKSSNSTSGYGAATNSLYVDNQVPARRHSDNTINVPRIQVALSSPSSSGSRTNLNQRASVSASKLANKWKLTAKTNQREASDKLSPNLGGALTYIRRHSSGNAQGGDGKDGGSGGKHHHNNDSSSSGSGGGGGQSNGGLGATLLNASPFKTKSSSNLGIDFLMSNRSMKRRYSAASMLGHQTQRKAEDLIDAGMKSVQNMFS